LKIRKLVQKTMWEKVGIVRKQKNLQSASKIFEKLKPRSFAAKNIVTVAKLVTQATIKRKKSLGTHCLEDGC